MPARDGAPPPPTPLDTGVVRDAGLTPTPDATAETCAPGARLGLCRICGEGGEEVAPAGDAECGIECGDLDLYRRDGAACVLTRHAPREGLGSCEGLGACRDAASDAWCAPTTPDGTGAVEDACNRVDGCLGDQPPAVTPLPGESCDGGGRCNADGACVPPPACAYDGQVLCGAGFDDAGQPYCQFWIEWTSCDDHCAALGLTCLQAWDDPVWGDRCETRGSIRCRSERISHVCRCAASR